MSHTDQAAAERSTIHATFEIEAHAEGTRLTLTEYGVYLDGHDTPEQREHGTIELMNALGEHLEASGVQG
jgi:hypothetical protein